MNNPIPYINEKTPVETRVGFYVNNNRGQSNTPPQLLKNEYI